MAQNNNQESFKIGNRVGWEFDKGQCLRVNIGVKSKRQILKNVRNDNLKSIRYPCNRKVLSCREDWMLQQERYCVIYRK